MMIVTGADDDNGHDDDYNDLHFTICLSIYL